MLPRAAFLYKYECLVKGSVRQNYIVALKNEIVICKNGCVAKGLRKRCRADMNLIWAKTWLATFKIGKHATWYVYLFCRIQSAEQSSWSQQMCPRGFSWQKSLVEKIAGFPITFTWIAKGILPPLFPYLWCGGGHENRRGAQNERSERANLLTVAARKRSETSNWTESTLEVDVAWICPRVILWI